MTRIKIIGSMCLALFISGTCLAADRTVAKYNGKDVLKSEVTERIRMPSGKLPEEKSDFDDYSKETKEQILAEFVQEKLLSVAAENEKVDQDSNYRQQLANFITQAKIKTYLEKHAKKKMSSSMIKAAYEDHIKELKTKDNLKVSHILLKTEADANKVAAEIKSQKISFANAAKEHSIDKMSGDKGGEIGFIAPGQVVPDFEKMAYTLAKGSVSAPVKTSFGWHIIKLLDSKKRDVPAMTKIKQKLEQGILMKLMHEQVGKLVQDAKVEILADKK